MLSDKTWRVESMLWLGVGLFGCMLVGSLVSGSLLKPGDESTGVTFQQVVVGALSFHVALFPLVHFFLKEQQTTWRSAFGFGSTGQSYALLLAAGVTVLVLPAAWLLTGWTGLALQQLGEKPVPQPMVIAIQHSNEVVSQIVRAIFAIVVAPPAEEILFRGILYPFVKQVGYPRLATWGTALLFGAIHANGMTFVALVFLGLVLTWLYEKTGNLLAPIFAHSLFNLTNFAWLMLTRA